MEEIKLTPHHYRRLKQIKEGNILQRFILKFIARWIYGRKFYNQILIAEKQDCKMLDINEKQDILCKSCPFTKLCKD